MWHRSADATSGTSFLYTQKFEFSTAMTACVQFYYHMHGAAHDVFALSISRTGSYGLVWSEKHPQGDHWHRARVKIDDFRGTLRFHSKYAANSDVGLDDITITEGACPPVTSLPSECDFEEGYCVFSQPVAPVDSFNWRRHQGQDPKYPVNGPPSDHTLGTQNGTILQQQAVNELTTAVVCYTRR